MKLLSYLKKLLFATILIGIIGCGQSDDESSEDGNSENNAIPAVEAVEARYGSLPLSERLSGTVIARNQVEIFPEISGRVGEVLVQNGQKVEEGDPIVRIEDRQFEEQVQQAEASLRINNAQLRQAESRYKELESRYNRQKRLADQDLSSAQELETLEAELESAEADVELAEAQVDQAQSTLEEQEDQLSKTIVRAPITGTLGQRNAEKGMQVGSSTRIFTIGDLDRLRVEVILTDNMLRNIEIGQTARVYTGFSVDGSENVLEAELARISPFLNNVTRSTEAEIDVENQNGRLRPGMFVAVDILYGESEQATLIPTSSLYTDPETGEEGVFVATTLGSEVEAVEDTSDSGDPPPLTQPIDVEFQPVDVIAEGRMEIGVDGIEPGSWIVTVGQDLLAEGRERARVRASTWERILALQGLQREDLLYQIMQDQES